MSDEQRLLLRPEEAARALGLSRARVFQLLATGELGSVKIGASRCVPIADLQGFVERLRCEHNDHLGDARCVGNCATSAA